MVSRILLVEDHLDTAKAFSRLLSIEGYHVRIADGFRSALASAEQDRFDLLVCDIGLPDGSGLDLMRMLAAQYQMKGIAVTGFGMPKDIADCIAAGFHSHILKPATFDQLKAAIAKCLPPPAAIKEEML